MSHIVVLQYPIFSISILKAAAARDSLALGCAPLLSVPAKIHSERAAYVISQLVYLYKSANLNP
jgi:hypothetical protein